MTAPTRTVVLDALLTVPTARPTPVSAAVASACVRFTTLGTRVGAPDETTRLTALPGAASVPASGFWLKTDPAGTVEFDAVLTVPSVRPAFTIAVVAAACVRLSTLGTVTVAGIHSN